MSEKGSPSSASDRPRFDYSEWWRDHNREMDPDDIWKVHEEMKIRHLHYCRRHRNHSRITIIKKKRISRKQRILRFLIDFILCNPGTIGGRIANALTMIFLLFAFLYIAFRSFPIIQQCLQQSIQGAIHP